MNELEAVGVLSDLKAGKIAHEYEAIDMGIMALNEYKRQYERGWADGHVVGYAAGKEATEITEEQAIDKLHVTGWMIRHDKAMTERPTSKWVSEADGVRCLACGTFYETITYWNGDLHVHDDSFCGACGAKMEGNHGRHDN